MRIFDWVQDKLYGIQEKKISSFSHNTLTSNPHKEEFNDWPQTLLAIGTFGETKMKEDTSKNYQEEEAFDTDDDDTDLSTDAKNILTKAKDLLADNKSGIRKTSTSLKFLLKKMILCHSGFVPTPSLKDPLPESRMEKILKAMLRKKIYPHSSAQPTTKCMDRQSSVKKYLVNKSMNRFQVEETKEKGEESNKWVKTDSEYIVLEI